jgi:hypothetical protein
MADNSRPASLNRHLWLGEALGHLGVSDFRDRQGLLIVVPTSPFFDSTGEVGMFTVPPARAFVPWDRTTRSFRTDAVVVFPLGTRLYSEERFKAAPKEGKVQQVGQYRVRTDDRLLPALVFEPTASAADGQRVAAVSYEQLWLPQGARFTAWASVHPSLFARPDIGKPRIEIHVRANGADVVAGEYVLDPMDVSERQYVPFEADLSAFGDQPVDLTIRVVSTDAQSTLPVVVVGEPRIRMSP